MGKIKKDLLRICYDQPSGRSGVMGIMLGVLDTLLLCYKNGCLVVGIVVNLFVELG